MSVDHLLLFHFFSGRADGHHVAKYDTRRPARKGREFVTSTQILTNREITVSWWVKTS